MAETKITNVIVPEVFTDYTMEPSIYRSRFFKSSIIEPSSVINQKLAGGGTTFNVPFWQDVASTESGVPSETVATTVNNITAEKQIAVRLERERAWGANSLSAILSGDSPRTAIGDKVIGYWTQDYDKTLISVAKGVIADNIANDSSDLVNVTATQFTDDGVIDSQALLGENGTVGIQSESGSDYVGIAVHPTIYALMRKLDLIDFTPISGQPRSLGSYMGMVVIVDRNLPLDTGVYTTIIFKSGAFQFGQTAVGYQPTELYRRPGVGFGTDDLYSRRVYTIHPAGAAFQSSSVAGVSPTNTELEAAANWSRVFAKENMRFVAYKHTV